MDGPSHYREAERLLKGDADDVATAQVHATLALVAASMQDDLDAYYNEDSSNIRAWGEAIA